MTKKLGQALFLHVKCINIGNFKQTILHKFYNHYREMRFQNFEKFLGSNEKLHLKLRLHYF